jgi:hypothetical protein
MWKRSPPSSFSLCVFRRFVLSWFNHAPPHVHQPYEALAENWLVAADMGKYKGGHPERSEGSSLRSDCSYGKNFPSLRYG